MMTSFLVVFLISAVLILNIGSSHGHGSPSPASPSPLDFDWKSYLERYGYLEHARIKTERSNDLSDRNTVVVAITTFQKNFGLKATGILDEATMSVMKTPRCGFPDIVNGTNVMLMPPHKHNINSSSKYATGFEILKWYTYQLGYFRTKDHFPFEAMHPLELAFKEWEDKTNFIFTDTQGFFEARIHLGFYKRDHGDKLPFDGPGKVLAHAFLPESGKAHFDSEEKWCFDNSNGVPRDAVDFQSVALHEIGHLLGLRHSAVRGAIMWPTFGPGFFATHLKQDDLDALKYIYGKQI